MKRMVNQRLVALAWSREAWEKQEEILAVFNGLTHP